MTLLAFRSALGMDSAAGGSTTHTVKWAGGAATPTAPPGDADLTAGSIVATNMPAIIYNLGQYAPNDVWSVTHSATRATLAAAVTAGAYHSVTLDRAAGLTPSVLRIKAARGGSSSPRGFAIRSSVDGYTADLVSIADIPTVRPPTGTLTQFGDYDISALGSQTSITFRIYHFAPAATSAVDFDDLEIDYLVTSGATPVENSVSDTYAVRAAVAASSRTDTYGVAAAVVGSVADTYAVIVSPATILNIGPGAGQNHFSLQYARTGDSSPSSATQADLAGGFQESPYFTPIGTTRVQFQARADAPIISGSGGARSELREVNADGSTAGWDPNVGIHEFHGRSTIAHLPPLDPEVVIAQLHDGNSDALSIRTQLVSGTIRLRARVYGTSITSPQFASPYVEGTEFEWKIRVDNGAVSFFYNDMVTPFITRPAGTLIPTAGVNTFYWKTGSYNQFDAASAGATEYASVELRDLLVTHPTLTSVESTVTDTYAVRAIAISSVSDTQAVRAVVAQSVGDTYAVRTSVAQTVSDTYAVRLAVPSSRSETYAVRVAIAQTVGDAYAVRTAVAASIRADTYSVRAVVAQSAADSYAVQAPVVSSRADTYAVRTAIAQTVSDTYTVRAPITQSVADTYAVRTAVAASTRADTYGVLAAVANSRTDTYAVRAAVTATVSDTYNVLSIAVTPATILNIGSGASQNHFSLQYARTGDPSPSAATQADLVAGFQESPYFTPVGSNARVQFQARADAPQIPGSGGARSELRETNANGTTAGWDANLGIHEFHGRTTIAHLPPLDPEVVIAQLHNGDADALSIRTQLVSGTIRLRARVNGVSVTTPQFASPYVEGTEFEWKIRLDDGAVSFFYNDMVTPLITRPAGTLAPTAGVTTWYWKTGSYNQFDTTTATATEYASVELRDLSVTHPVLTPVESSAGDTYAVRTSVTQSRTDTYAVRTGLVATRSDTYAVGTSIAQTAGDTWAVRGSVTRAITDTFAVRGAVNSTRADSWAVRALASAAATEAWAVFTAVAPAVRTDTWSVRGGVVKPVGDTWAVRALAASSRTDTFAVRVAILDSAADTWQTFKTAAQAVADTYAVRAVVIGEVAEQWDTAQATPPLVPVVAAPSETLVVSPESRTMLVGPESRTLVVQAAVRAFVITGS